MIFVTVGTEQFPFDRMLNWVDRAMNELKSEEPVIVQYGTSTLRIPGALHQDFLSPELFNYFLHQSRIVISHCGEGSFLSMQRSGKPFMLVPRRGGLGEHVDDHQWEMAEAFQKLGTNVARIPNDIKTFIGSPQRSELLAFNALTVVNALVRRYESGTERSLIPC
jgi:UDP-N-acetylglucosamine transferase subunit ALG13